MDKERFGNDKELNNAYEKLNETKFRNYVFDYDKNGFYCEYIESYECKIDDLKQALNEIKKYIKEKQKIQYKFALSHIECDDILEIIDKFLGGSDGK